MGTLKQEQTATKMKEEDLINLGFEKEVNSYYHKNGMFLKVWHDGTIIYGNDTTVDSMEYLELLYERCTGKKLTNK